jgi:hypothetical protein
MIKFKLLKKEDNRHIAILCFSQIDFWSYLDVFNLEKIDIGYRSIKHNENVYYCISEYEDLINKQFNTYKLTTSFVDNPYSTDILYNIHKHII